MGYIVYRFQLARKMRAIIYSNKHSCIFVGLIRCRTVRYTLPVQTASGGKEYTLLVDTSGGGKGYTLHIYAYAGGNVDTQHVHTAGAGKEYILLFYSCCMMPKITCKCRNAGQKLV
jgi:hypothetical protein